MSYNYEYPYVDPERYNDDWLLYTTLQTQNRMSAMEKEWKDYQSMVNEQIDGLRVDYKNFTATITGQVDGLRRDYQNFTATVNNSLDDMREDINNFPSQIPSLVQNYLNTLTPSWNEMSKKQDIYNMQDIYGKSVALVANATPGTVANITASLSSYASKVTAYHVKAVPADIEADICIVIIYLGARHSVSNDDISTILNGIETLKSITFKSRKIILCGEIDTVLRGIQFSALAQNTTDFESRGRYTSEVQWSDIDAKWISNNLHRPLSHYFTVAPAYRFYTDDSGAMRGYTQGRNSFQKIMDELQEMFSGIHNYILMGFARYENDVLVGLTIDHMGGNLVVTPTPEGNPAIHDIEFTLLTYW